MIETTTGEIHRPGRIEVVCGSMFSGKTEELIRRMKRAVFAKQKVEIFKPAIDTRYSDAAVVSHDHNSITSTPVDASASILLSVGDDDAHPTVGQLVADIHQSHIEELSFIDAHHLNVRR